MGPLSWSSGTNWTYRARAGSDKVWWNNQWLWKYSIYEEIKKDALTDEQYFQSQSGGIITRMGVQFIDGGGLEKTDDEYPGKSVAYGEAVKVTHTRAN